MNSVDLMDRIRKIVSETILLEAELDNCTKTASADSKIKSQIKAGDAPCAPPLTTNNTDVKFPNLMTMKESEFTYQIAKAAQAGKKEVKIGKKTYPVKMSKERAQEILDEMDKELHEKDKKKPKKKQVKHPKQYGAPEGSKRDKQLDQTMSDLKSKDPDVRARAYRRRERMEKKERQKPGFKNKPRSDSQKESVMRMTELQLRETIRDVLLETLLMEKKKRKQQKGKKRAKKTAKRKSSGSSGKLSAKTKETLRKKAKKRGLTPSSVYAEFRKGLAAWASSGSRKGMSQHQWAHARVNSANPSKSWAVVKRAKSS